MQKERIARTLGWVLAIALAAIFGATGVMKLYSPAVAGIGLVQSGVPSAFGLPAAVILGSVELFAAVLLLLPAYRRTGAVLTAVLTGLFIAYMAARYTQLKGVECGCLPGWYREVGVRFFVEDGLMLAGAIGLAVLSPPVRAAGRWFRTPALLLLGVLVAGSASAVLEPVLAQENTLTMRVMDRDGRVAEMPLSSRSYTVLYFYNPTCLTCRKVSRELAGLRLTAPLIVLPDGPPEQAYEYLNEAGMKNALVSPDYVLLSERFGLRQVPTIYLLKGSRPERAIIDFESGEFQKALRDHGLLN